MFIKNLLQQTCKPSLYEKGNAFMWDDPYISKQLLEVHLNKEIDLASRKESSIDITIDYILNQCDSKKLNILDLGCGPGLYCEKLHDKGHHVTGIDISSNSIDYAVTRAKQNSKTIEYQCESYLDIDLPKNTYDLVIIIFTDLGVLLPEERILLLNKIYKSLKPNGRLVFDVLEAIDLESKITPSSWDMVDTGFWSNKPHLVLSNSFLYEEEKVILYQHNVIQDDEGVKTYRFWTHYFNEKDINNIISKTPFKLINSSSSVLPETDNWSGKHVSFYTLVK